MLVHSSLGKLLPSNVIVSEDCDVGDASLCADDVVDILNWTSLNAHHSDTGWHISWWTSVGLTLIWDVQPSYPAAQPVLPISHQPRQNPRAEGGTSPIKVNPTEVRQEMRHPVKMSLPSSLKICNLEPPTISMTVKLLWATTLTKYGKYRGMKLDMLVIETWLLMAKSNKHYWTWTCAHEKHMIFGLFTSLFCFARVDGCTVVLKH